MSMSMSVTSVGGFGAVRYGALTALLLTALRPRPVCHLRCCVQLPQVPAAEDDAGAGAGVRRVRARGCSGRGQPALDDCDGERAATRQNAVTPTAGDVAVASVPPSCAALHRCDVAVVGVDVIRVGVVRVDVVRVDVVRVFIVCVDVVQAPIKDALSVLSLTVDDLLPASHSVDQVYTHSTHIEHTRTRTHTHAQTSRRDSHTQHQMVHVERCAVSCRCRRCRRRSVRRATETASWRSACC
jgi:hypothetical protein